MIWNLGGATTFYYRASYLEKYILCQPGSFLFNSRISLKICNFLVCHILNSRRTERLRYFYRSCILYVSELYLAVLRLGC